MNSLEQGVQSREDQTASTAGPRYQQIFWLPTELWGELSFSLAPSIHRSPLPAKIQQSMPQITVMTFPCKPACLFQFQLAKKILVTDFCLSSLLWIWTLLPRVLFLLPEHRQAWSSVLSSIPRTHNAHTFLRIPASLQYDNVLCKVLWRTHSLFPSWGGSSVSTKYIHM